MRYRSSLVAAILMLLGANSTSAEPTTCKSLKTPAARLTCYEKQDNKAETGSGNVEGTITWQYNNFVGTKGDVGARIIFVRAPLEETVSKLPEPERKMLSGGIPVSESEGAGVYSTEADGFGKFSIDGLPAGSYNVFIFSSKTRPGPEDIMTNSCKARFGTHFQSFVFVLSKAYCTTAKVSSGRTSTISHDFGNTYI